MSSALRVEKLRPDHEVGGVTCGHPGLDRFLARHALRGQQSGASATYIGWSDGEPVGFYTLVVGQVEYEGAPDRLVKGLARYPVPVMVLARLGVASGWQGRGVGAGLLKDAVLRTLQAAEIAGIRALVVHAKDEGARAFYERFDFVPSPSDPWHLYVLLKDLRAMLRRSAAGA